MNERDTKIDIFKGLLVLGMIYCHVLQFFCDSEVYPSAGIITSFINIVTFPGFVFCFGYSTRIAYLSRELKEVYLRILNSAFKTLAAFYISGISFRVFVDGRPFNFDTAVKVITLSDIPGWSEFLVSFSLFTLLAAVLFRPLKLLLENRLLFWTVFVLLFFTTLIPYQMINTPQLGLLVGTTRFASFPVLQYMPFYLLGMYFQRHKPGFDLGILAGAIVLTAAAAVNMALHGGELPGRFPPTVFWLFLSMLPLHLYYTASVHLDKVQRVSGYFQPIGRSTLMFLLLSNILIFALDGSGSVTALNTLESLLLGVLLISIIAYFVHITGNNRQPQIFMRR